MRKNYKNQGFCMISFFLLFCMSSNGISYAQIKNLDLPKRKGVKLGGAIFHSALKVSEIYESNIFLSDDPVPDSITVTNPSFGIDVPLGDNKIWAEYNMFFNNYYRHREENHTDHKINALGEINLTDYKISISELYNRFTNRGSSETSNRIRQENNISRIGISSKFEKLGFDIGYTNKVDNYLTDSGLFGNLTYKDRNSMSHIMDATASYRFLPKTRALFETDMGFINYKNSLSPDSYFIESLVGLKGDLRNNFSINFKVGGRYQDYKSSSLLNDDSFIGLVARGGVDYSFTKRDIFGLKVERADYESLYQNMNYYVANSIGLNYSHHFNNKITAKVFGSYQLNTYPKESTEAGANAKRSDRVTGLGFGCKYDIRKWISTELKYEYKNRDSKFAIFNYEDHLTTVAFTVGF